MTARDFAYVWQRVLNPHTVAPPAYPLNRVRNAAAIQRGKLPPEGLSVRSIDDFADRAACIRDLDQICIIRAADPSALPDHGVDRPARHRPTDVLSKEDRQ